MKTFQTGGVASAANITRGFPRVLELFEARRPTGAALLARTAGRVAILDEEGGRVLAILSPESGAEPREERHRLPSWAELVVAAGDPVVAGDRLTAGPLDPAALLRLRGRHAAQEYLAGTIREIYGAQGVEIHDQHIEIIVGRMLDWVVVADAGDSDLAPGLPVARGVFAAARAACRLRGVTAPTGHDAVLGLTAAALAAQGFLAAASFQETAHVLAGAALDGRIDRLADLKAGVLLGALIPAGTGYASRRKRDNPALQAAD